MDRNKRGQDNNYPKPNKEDKQHQSQEEFIDTGNTQKEARQHEGQHDLEQKYTDSQSGNQSKLPDTKQKPNEGDIIKERNTQNLKR